MGRGLNAILGSDANKDIQTAADSGAEKVVGNILDVSIEDIYPNENQPRQNFDKKALEELAESIKTLGIIQPITLRKEKDRFLIISGERRFRASKMAGLKTIPAYIRLVNDQELLEMALVENIQREDLDPIEVALTYQRLLEEVNLTQENLSSRIGKDRSTITNSLRLLRLSPEIQSAIRNQEISAGHGRALLSLSGSELHAYVFEKIIENKLNVRQTEALVNRIKKGNNPTSAKSTSSIPNHLKKAQKRISDNLGLEVEIKTTAKGKKGKVILNFNSEDEIERILKALNS